MINTINGISTTAVQAFTGIVHADSDLINKETVRRESPTQKNPTDNKQGNPQENNVTTSRQKETLKKSDFSEFEAKLRELLGEESNTIEFSLDPETKKMIMKVIDPKTKEVIRQVPSEIALKIARIVASTLKNSNITDAKI